MRKTYIGTFGILAVTGAVLLAAATPVRPVAELGSSNGRQRVAAAEMKVDAVHSSVVFKIRHLGVSTFWGRFRNVRGTCTIDAENPAANSFDVFVETKDIDTASGQRDDHLRSTDFFNAREFPELRFTSTSVAKGEKPGTLTVVGDLTLHGVTKEITVAFENVIAPRQTPMGTRGGFDGQFTIKRTDFGMDKYVAEGALGDEVTIFVSIEGRVDG